MKLDRWGPNRRDRLNLISHMSLYRVNSCVQYLGRHPIHRHHGRMAHMHFHKLIWLRCTQHSDNETLLRFMLGRSSTYALGDRHCHVPPAFYLVTMALMIILYHEKCEMHRKMCSYYDRKDADTTTVCGGGSFLSALIEECWWQS